MPILARVRSVFRSVTGRGRAHRDLDEDVQGYFDMLVDEKTAGGLSQAEARRRARLEMGGVEQVKESVRDVRPTAWLDTVVRDVRYSVRLLLKTPAFSLIAILVLALGIGANAAAFGLINVLLFQQPPGAGQPGQVVGVYSHDPSRPDSYRSFSYPDYEDIRDGAGVFEHVMAYRSAIVGVTEADASRRTDAALVTGSYFATLGVRMAAGRAFSQDEESPGSRAAVMVLSHAYWQALGGGTDVLGRTLVVNARPFTVVGIAPAGFAGTTVLIGPEFWMPLGAEDLLSGPASEARPARLLDRANRQLKIVGRLKPGLSVEAAQAELRALSGRLEQSRPRDNVSHVLIASPLARTEDSDRPGDDAGLVVPLGALMGAALVLLVIASLNVANMQLARGTSRRKEIAMRLALGAGRGRIVGQLLTEGLVLALAGGAVGLVASVWTLQVVVGSLAPVVQQAMTADVTPDWRVWLAALAFCTLAAVAFGLGPAWKLSRLDLLPEMKSQDGTGAGRGLRRFGTRNLLVASQIALSLALLTAAGLFVRGAVEAAVADPGYRFDHQVLLRVDAASGGYDNASGRQAYRQLIDRVRSTPGIESAALASLVAFGDDSFSQRVLRSESAGSGEGADARGTVAQSYAVGAAYFDTLGLSMLRGREFTAAEELDPTTSPVVIIDEPLASAIFPGQDPLGQFIQFASTDRASGARPMEIVGVAPGLRHRLSDRGPVPHVYLPLGSHYRGFLNIHARTTADGRSGRGETLRSVRDAVRAADTRLAVLAVLSLEEARDGSPRTWLIRTAGRAFGAFGAIALFMAAIGLYGVKAYLVARRTREIGVRMALGADAGDVVRMILKDGALLLAVSVAIGFALAVGVGRAVSSLLVGVDAFDPWVLSAATLVLSVAVLAASYVPARRATRVSPVTALRTE